MTREMSDRIRVIGFVMSIFIIIYHCRYGLAAMNAVDERINAVVISIGGTLAYVAMCWFFSISGFLLFRNLTLNNYVEKLKKRAVTLLIPYFVWQFISYAQDIIMQLLRHDRPVLSELFRNVIGVLLMDRFPPNEPLWYIYVLFLMTALSPILLLIFKNKRIGWLLTAAITFILYILSAEKNALFEKIVSYGYMRNILSYIPAFMIGAFMGRYSENSDGTDKLKYIVSLVVASLFLESCFSGITVDTVGKILPTLLLYFTPMISAARNRKIYNLTFLIYALHEPLHIVKDYMMKLLYELISYASVTNILVRVLFPIFVIVFALLFYKLLQKISPKLLRVITGGRV